MHAQRGRPGLARSRIGHKFSFARFVPVQPVTTAGPSNLIQLLFARPDSNNSNNSRCNSCSCSLAAFFFLFFINARNSLSQRWASHKSTYPLPNPVQTHTLDWSRCQSISLSLSLTSSLSRSGLVYDSTWLQLTRHFVSTVPHVRLVPRQLVPSLMSLSLMHSQWFPWWPLPCGCHRWCHLCAATVQ